MPSPSIEVKTEFGFPVVPADQENAHVIGYVRIKPSDGAKPMADHVMLILDLSYSMTSHLGELRKSVGKIINRLKPNYDKITLLGFGGDTHIFCTFESVRNVQENLEEYLPLELPRQPGNTDFRKGVNCALTIVRTLKASGGKPNVGNESFRWDDHNHVVIFMTDGRDYGKVPWGECEALAEQGATLHTIALNTTEINAKVRKKLMEMAKIGGGGFNFCRNVSSFHVKVDQLLDMSLGAVCPPTKFSIELMPGTELIMVSLLEHIEQMQGGDDVLNPVFTLPALRKDDRKIILFRAKIGPTRNVGTTFQLFDCRQIPNLLTSPDDGIAEIPVAPFDVFKRAVERGMNGDVRVFILMHNLESELEDALQEAASNDNVTGFKNKAKQALIEAKIDVEENFSRNPRGSDLLTFIDGFLKALDEADTVEDPSSFFSTLFAEMRTRR
jgi:uncharacterized protein YegL